MLIVNHNSIKIRAHNGLWGVRRAVARALVPMPGGSRIGVFVECVSERVFYTVYTRS